MTNWVTIRVPESDRDTAKDTRPEDVTHGDCLVAGAKALARETQAPPPDDVPPLSDGADMDTEALAEQLKNEISMVSEPGAVFTEDDVERLINRIDDLESRLPRKVAEELR